MEIITELNRLKNKGTSDAKPSLSQEQPVTMDDTHLLEKIKNGNLEAFEKLFRKYYAQLINYAVIYVKQKNDAEEVVQNFFFNIWKNKENVKISGSFKSYAYRSVYNNSIQYVRKQRRSTSIEDDKKIRRTMVQSTSDELQYQQLRERIEKILDLLPEKNRRIFEMNRFEGLKYQEIADKLSISIKTVEANITRALKTFRKYLKDYKYVILFF